MDTDEYDLLDLKMVCSLLESGTTDENLEKKVILSQGETLRSAS